MNHQTLCCSVYRMADRQRVGPTAGMPPMPRAGVSNVVLAERQRCIEIIEMKRPGNEAVIENAISTGATSQATALKLLRGGTSRSRTESLIEAMHRAQGISVATQENKHEQSH